MKLPQWTIRNFLRAPTKFSLFKKNFDGVFILVFHYNLEPTCEFFIFNFDHFFLFGAGFKVCKVSFIFVFILS